MAMWAGNIMALGNCFSTAERFMSLFVLINSITLPENKIFHV